jgi:polyphosphate kinase 2 (PPK2 family)
VTDEWEHFKAYDKFRKVSEKALRETNAAHAPWTVIEGADSNYRYLTAGRTLLDAIKKRLAGERPAVSRAAALPKLAIDRRTVFSGLDYETRLTRGVYRRELEKYQGRINLLLRHKKFRRKLLIVVFEGIDAAGKGGSIRRVTGALDARQYRVIPIAAPTEEERAQPYLGRFWRSLPRRGRPFLTVPGTAACWSSGSKNSVRKRTGCAPIKKSTNSRSRSPKPAAS